MSLDTVNNLISLSDLKLYLGISTGTTTYDARLTDIINAVSWRFNAETGRKLKARAITEYRDGDNSTFIFTNEYPINSNSTDIEIYIDTERSYSTSDKVSSDDIVIYSTMGKIVLDDDSFDEGAQSVKIVYNGGYSTIPYDLQYAAKEYARLIKHREDSNNIGVRSESVEGGSITYAEDIPWSVKMVLQKYKKKDYNG